MESVETLSFNEFMCIVFSFVFFFTFVLLKFHWNWSKNITYIYTCIAWRHNNPIVDRATFVRGSVVVVVNALQMLHLYFPALRLHRQLTFPNIWDDKQTNETSNRTTETSPPTPPAIIHSISRTLSLLHSYNLQHFTPLSL